jgi:tRNA threonylcarbamoyladenosine dehydratase
MSAPAPPDRFRLSRRFDRTGRLLGDAAMTRLANARVVVFGLGGVGSYAVEGLVRSGVGHLTLVDFDDVCITNINRQLHATTRTVGKGKAELMAARCREINP